MIPSDPPCTVDGAADTALPPGPSNQQCIPTSRPEEFKIGKCEVTVMDLGGHDTRRDLWPTYYAEVEGGNDLIIVFCVCVFFWLGVKERNMSLAAQHAKGGAPVPPPYMLPFGAPLFADDSMCFFSALTSNGSVVFVVDSTDRARLPLARDVLEKALAHKYMAGKRVLVRIV